MADRKISDESLSEQVAADITASRAIADEKSAWRQEMLHEYRGGGYGNEKEGRSQFISTDMMDAIEWIMPSAMRIFAGTQSAVSVTGVGAEDQEKARKVNALIYYQLQKKNPYFRTMYCWFKDALRFKTSVVKRTWRYDYEAEDVTYKDLTEEEFSLLESNPFIDILKVEKAVGAASPSVDDASEGIEGAEASTLPSVQYPIVKVRNKTVLYDGPCIENVPPEMFYVDPSHMVPGTVDGAMFAGQICMMTASEMRQRVNAGLFSKRAVDDAIEKGPDHDFASPESGAERQERYENAGLSAPKDDETPESARAKFKVYEHYAQIDVNGDGILEDWIVWFCNGEVLADRANEYDGPPFSVLSPIMEPNSFDGISVCELVRDIQKMKTSLFRLMLDNAAFQVNGRYTVLDGQVKMSDLLHNNKPGGVIRMKQPGAVTRLDTPQLPNTMFNLLEYFEGIKENRTGVSRLNQGLDPSSLNKTASGINALMNASVQRTELIARIFAETGVMDLVKALVAYNQKFFNRTQQIRLFGEPFDISPEDVAGDFDLEVAVGVGNIDQNQKAQKVAMGAQMTVALYGPQRAASVLDAMMREWWNSSGFKNAEQFIPAAGQPALPPGGESGEQEAGVAPGGQVGNGSEVPSGVPDTFDFNGMSGGLNFAAGGN